MASSTIILDQKPLPQPYIISKVVYKALSPLDQLAAQALERVGQVRIVDEQENNFSR
jgi:hypothetical protein